MMTNLQIDAKITEINLLEAQIKELKALADARRGELKEELDQRQAEMVDTGINRVFYEAYSKRIVDTKALKADGLYEKYSKENTNLMFRITTKTAE